jgi:YD repeat-containing protein
MNPVAGGPVLRPVEVRIGNPAGLAAPAWMALPQPTSADSEAWPADRVWTFTYDANSPAAAELTGFTDAQGLATTLAWQTHGFFNPVSSENNLFRNVGTATSTDPTTGTTLTRSWTWAPPVVGNETAWTTTLTQAWSGSGIVSAPNPTVTYSFAPPSDPNFGNAVPILIDTYNPQTGVHSTVRTTYAQVGVDRTLSALATQTASVEGSPVVALTTSSDPASGFPNTTSHTCGSWSDLVTYTYESHPDLLEPKRLTAVATQHSKSGTAFSTAPTQKMTYDPTTWFLQQKVLDGGTDGQLGTKLTYDPGSGRPTGGANIATAPLATTTGIATRLYSLDPTSGLPSQLQVTFDTPIGSDAYTPQWSSYDTADRPKITVDGVGVTTTRTWDARGRIVQMVQGGQGDLTCTYPDERTQTVTQNGRTTTITLDGFGRVRTRVRGADGVTETYVYDANGNQAGMTETNAGGASRGVSQVFNALGRVVTKVPVRGPTVSYAYTADDTAGNQITTATFAGYTTTTAKDLWGNTVSATDTAGTTTAATFDAQGHALTVTTGPQTRTFTYNQLGLLVTRQEPETGTTAFSNFNAQGQPRTIQEVGVRTRTLLLDGLGRTWQVSNGSTNRKATFSGLLPTGGSTTRGGAVTTLTYSYGAYGRLSGETASVPGASPSSWTIGYAYDGQGRLNQVTYPTGRIINYKFDDLSNYGRVTQVQDGSTTLALPFTHN